MPRLSQTTLSLSIVGCVGLVLACGGGFNKPPTRPPANSNDPQLATSRSTSTQTVQPTAAVRRAFDDKDMTTPIREFREYPVEDYQILPNCLSIFKECLEVPSDGRTTAQYKEAVGVVARKPCRVAVEVVDVSADHDVTDLKLLADDGTSGLVMLGQGGDLGNYTRHLREPFTLSDMKKKGLDARNRSKGDKIVLVGLGDVVPASGWGASSPTRGMPKGDERYVMLRAFGIANRYHPNQYEFAFMVRNWYIASQ